MKRSINYTFIALIAIASVYTSCKKSQTTSKSTVNAGDVSRQIAVSLYKSLSGQYGGANITDGIKAPLGLTPNAKGPRINSVSPYCGYVIDTTYSFSDTRKDTVRGYWGHFKFTYGCTSTTLDSYLLNDSIVNTINYPLYSGTFKLSQKYFVKALDQTYKISSVEGYINFSAHTSVLNAVHITTQYYNTDSQYALHGVKVDVSSGTADVIEGTANFTSQVVNLDSTTAIDGYFSGFTGTITFLGQHIAKVSIHVGDETKLYTVNMVTGSVTAG